MHGAVASFELGKEVTAAVLADLETAPIAEPLRATLRLLQQMTLAPQSLERAHLQAALAAGVEREALRDAIYVAAAFNVIVRMADAMDFRLPDAAGNAASAKSLLRFGYRL